MSFQLGEPLRFFMIGAVLAAVLLHFHPQFLCIPHHGLRDDGPEAEEDLPNGYSEDDLVGQRNEQGRRNLRPFVPADGITRRVAHEDSQFALADTVFPPEYSDVVARYFVRHVLDFEKAFDLCIKISIRFRSRQCPETAPRADSGTSQRQFPNLIGPKFWNYRSVSVCRR